MRLFYETPVGLPEQQHVSPQRRGFRGARYVTRYTTNIFVLTLFLAPKYIFFAQIPTHFACRTNDDYHLQDQSRFGNQEITKEPQSELFINILNLCRRLPPLIWSLQPAVSRPSHRFRLCSDFTILRKCLMLKCAQPSLQIRSWLLAGLCWGLKFVKQSSSNPSNIPLMMSC